MGLGESRDTARALTALASALEPTGFFAAAPRRYYVRLGVLLATVPALAALAWRIPTSLLGLGAAALLGIACGQLGFYGHDAVHGAVCTSRPRNAIVGHLCFSLVNGLGFAYWMRVHVAHHKHLQRDGLDPDVDFPNVLSVTTGSAAAKTGVWRRLTRWQAWYFWPVTLLYAHRLRWQGIARMAQSPRDHRADLAAVALHLAGSLVVPSLVWSPTAAIVVYAVSSASVGVYLGLVFAVNHIGMRAIAADEHVEFVRRHFDCTRNISNHPVWDFMFGGLNFHTAHHLFPTVPHERLRRGRDVLRGFGAARGLAYHEMTFGAAVIAVSRHLAAIGRPASPGPEPRTRSSRRRLPPCPS